MSDDALKPLLPALGIAAFERDAEGSFRALAPAPAWFPRLADTTFPFLGHILDELTEFLRSHSSGTQDWGPCAETGTEGQEFHYLVTAVAAEGRQYLVFHIDRNADRLREILQKVRDDDLDDARDRRTRRTLAAQALGARNQMLDVVGRLMKESPTPEQQELLRELATLSTTIAAVADQLT
jgi:hypothetical protein